MHTSLPTADNVCVCVYVCVFDYHQNVRWLLMMCAYMSLTNLKELVVGQEEEAGKRQPLGFQVIRQALLNTLEKLVALSELVQKLLVATNLRTCACMDWCVGLCGCMLCICYHTMYTLQ